MPVRYQSSLAPAARIKAEPTDDVADLRPTKKMRKDVQVQEQDELDVIAQCAANPALMTLQTECEFLSSEHNLYSPSMSRRHVRILKRFQVFVENSPAWVHYLGREFVSDRLAERVNAFLTLYVEVTRNKSNTADPERRITPSELYTATTDLIRVICDGGCPNLKADLKAARAFKERVIQHAHFLALVRELQPASQVKYVFDEAEAQGAAADGLEEEDSDSASDLNGQVKVEDRGEMEEPCGLVKKEDQEEDGDEEEVEEEDDEHEPEVEDEDEDELEAEDKDEDDEQSDEEETFGSDEDDEVEDEVPGAMSTIGGVVGYDYDDDLLNPVFWYSKACAPDFDFLKGQMKEGFEVRMGLPRQNDGILTSIKCRFMLRLPTLNAPHPRPLNMRSGNWRQRRPTPEECAAHNGEGEYDILADRRPNNQERARQFAESAADPRLVQLHSALSYYGGRQAIFVELEQHRRAPTLERFQLFVATNSAWAEFVGKEFDLDHLQERINEFLITCLFASRPSKKGMTLCELYALTVDTIAMASDKCPDLREDSEAWSTFTNETYKHARFVDETFRLEHEQADEHTCI
ncbi:hypothetical protein BC629DRAFT_1438650 [Irpex lacteus]|nr:hypothetical protein BC629DRAFT_1438650 [Irpex lacteus]